MNDRITLRSGVQSLEIPLTEFMAGWAVMCNDFSLDVIAADADGAWLGQSLPLPAQRLGNDGPIEVRSVETLCRILCADASWHLHDDAGFLSRNATILKTCDADSAKLHETAISRWGATSQEMRDMLLERADCLIFPVMMACGLSQD